MWELSSYQLDWREGSELQWYQLVPYNTQENTSITKRSIAFTNLSSSRPMQIFPLQEHDVALCSRFVKQIALYLQELVPLSDQQALKQLQHQWHLDSPILKLLRPSKWPYLCQCHWQKPEGKWMLIITHDLNASMVVGYDRSEKLFRKLESILGA